MSSVRHVLTERFPKLYLYAQMLSFPQQVGVRADSASTLVLLFSHARRNKSHRFVLHKSDIQFTAIGVRGECRVKGQRGAGFENKGSRGGFNAAKGRDVLIFKLNSPLLIPWKRSWSDEHNFPPRLFKLQRCLMMIFFDVLTVINQTSLSNSSCDYQLGKWKLLELEDTETRLGKVLDQSTSTRRRHCSVIGMEHSVRLSSGVPLK